MCGITGYFNYSSEIADKKILKRMCDSIAHRGPDAEGLFVDGPLALGHRRLAIIDLSPNGAQPMTESQGRFTIVYNGEIYNFLELKEELSQKGHHFQGTSDTEVILRAFQEWGVSSFSRFNGIFSFALWDKAERTLLLARDPVGIKPLFFHEGSDKIIFGSEIKAILSSGFVSREIDNESISDFFCQNYVAHPKTGWKHVQQLEPGHYLEVKNGKISKKEYSRFTETPGSEKNWQEEFNHRFKAAVKHQTISDVPVGAFLSGGLDSSAVAKALRENNMDTVQLFTVRFKEEAYDESPTAVSTAKTLGLPIELIEISDDLRDLPEKISLHLEEPSSDPSSLAVYLMCKHVSKKVKVALSGDGGDELLAGYDTYRATTLANRFHLHHLKPALALGSKLTKFIPVKDERYSLQQVATRFAAGASLPFPLNHASWRTIQYPATTKELFGEALRPFVVTQSHLEKYAASTSELAASDQLTQMLHMDFRYYLPNQMLTKVDRMSMAHGLEVRVPFLDLDFVRFCRQIPPNWKLKDGKTKKFILKEYLKDKLPQSTLKLPKSGFSFPIEILLRGIWGDLLQDLMREFRDDISPFLHISAVEKMLKNHKEKKADYRFELFNILMFCLWIKNRKTAWLA